MNLHKEKGFVYGEISVDGFSRSGAFGNDPDNFKIHSIYATSSEILVNITTKDNKIVCYITMSYKTEKHALDPKNHNLNFLDTTHKNFGQITRRFKQLIYS